jgi:hypothetical protein
VVLGEHVGGVALGERVGGAWWCGFRRKKEKKRLRLRVFFFFFFETNDVDDAQNILSFLLSPSSLLPRSVASSTTRLPEVVPGVVDG